MDEAFYAGYVSYLSDVEEPPRFWNPNQCWAWLLGWRLHEHLILAKMRAQTQ